VRVFERSPLERLDDGDPAIVRTPSGTVRARTAVIALNAYGAALGFMPRRILPVHTYIVLTEPIADGDLEEIGWGARRTSLETARNFIHYFRLTADNRILFGGDDAKLYWRGGLRDIDRTCFEGLEHAFRSFFPSLEHVRFTHRWGGPVAVTLDMFPAFGASGARRNLFYAAGYSGHGVSLANYAGRIMAPHVLAKLGHYAAPVHAPLPFGRQPPYVGPNPVRYLGMQAYRLALHAQDRIQRA